MSGKKKKQRTTRAAPPPLPELPQESRAAEVATIWWMLAAMFTFCAEAIGLAVRLFFLWSGEVDESLAPLALVPHLTLGVGIVSGTFAVLLTPLVYKLRQTRPPEMVTVFVVLIGLVPLVTLVIRLVRGS